MAYQSAAEVLAKLDRAQSALLKQSDLQFHLKAQKPPEPPVWLVWLQKHLGTLLQPGLKTLGPLAPYIFWTVLALGVLAILYLIGLSLYDRMTRGAAPIGKLQLAGGLKPWLPTAEQARILLEDADRLAGEGRFDEAAHLILLRSVQDIQTRRPNAVSLSLTSRDIARMPALPPLARDTFAGIAEAVERSLFGGQPLGRIGFERCRSAYEAFVDAGSWA